MSKTTERIAIVTLLITNNRRNANAASLSPISETTEDRGFIVSDPNGRQARVFQTETPTEE